MVLAVTFNRQRSTKAYTKSIMVLPTGTSYDGGNVYMGAIYIFVLESAVEKPHLEISYFLPSS